MLLVPGGQSVLQVAVGEDNLVHVVLHVGFQCILQAFQVEVREEDKRKTIGDRIISNVSNLKQSV